MKSKPVWPTFEPIDPNATCKLCGRSWQFHGMDLGHCEPCDKCKISGYMSMSPLGHKGKCVGKGHK